ncbi:MAG: hypothetical protein RR336_12685, partial [Oscillospiraceae bacterium]
LSLQLLYAGKYITICIRNDVSIIPVCSFDLLRLRRIRRSIKQTDISEFAEGYFNESKAITSRSYLVENRFAGKGAYMKNMVQEHPNVMTINDLSCLLAKKRVPKHICNLDLDGNGMQDQRICITRLGDAWKVFYCERGHEFSTKTHKNESDACTDVFG